MVAIIIVGVIEAIILAGILYFIAQQGRGALQATLNILEGHVSGNSELVTKFESLYGKMVPLPELRKLMDELRGVLEAVKAERGRITITKAELETVETRLRELEEIERELEASGIETKEELKILKKKETDLSGRNQALKEQITKAMAAMDSAIQELELNAQMQEHVDKIKTELLQTQERIDVILLEIEQGNEQYMILKKRYDALDIEYAQLYEKFAEAEEG